MDRLSDYGSLTVADTMLQIRTLARTILLSAMAATGLGRCAQENISAPVCYVSFRADGALRELRADGTQTVFYTTEHSSRQCMTSDSVQTEYGCDYQLYSGNNVLQDVIIYFYMSDLKSRLAQYNGVYYYADPADAHARLPRGPLRYFEWDCQSLATVELYYYNSGKLYRSNLYANQSGSLFELTRSEVIRHSAFGTSILLEGTFACRMYTTSGDSIFLSEGKFLGVINNPR